MLVKAINSKHQKTINSFLQWDRKYDNAVNENNRLNKDNSPKQCRAYSKAYDLWEQLPKREQQNIIKQMPQLKDCY